VSEKNVHEAILAVMNEVGYVQRDGTMRGGGSYKYASEAAFIQALRESMVTHGLYIYPDGSLICPMDIDTYETSNGTTMNLVTIQRRYLLVHAPSNTNISIQSFGQGADTGDKAIGKAMTNSYKYALRNTFMMETGDDPDHTSSQEQKRKPKEVAYATSREKYPDNNNRRITVDWEEVNKNFPSPNMTDIHKAAWQNVIITKIAEGLSLNQATVAADEAYYTFVEKDNG